MKSKHSLLSLCWHLDNPQTPHPPFFSGVGLSPLSTATTSGLLYKSQVIDEGDCGAIGGMKIGRGN
jgi:hypothetical protein